MTTLATRPTPAPQFSATEHPLFTFGQVSDPAKAHRFARAQEADTFASGIREAEVVPYMAVKPGCWLVRVGPWMFVRDIAPRS